MDLKLGGLCRPLLHPLQRTELLSKAAALKQKQDLERQEAELKAKREELELETTIAASDAKLKLLDDFAIGRMSSS